MYTIATVVIVGLYCLKDLSRATTCDVMTKNVNEPKVATMCKNSTVSGTVVYVDTDLAALTGMQSGLVCWCSIKIQHGKQMNSTMYYPGNVHETCGTTITYEADTGIQDQGLCSSNGASILIPTSQHMNMSLNRRNPPFISTLCFRLELKYCDDYSYQCDDGTCISSYGRCDAFPDCDDHSDEEKCGPIACVEGQVPCDDNTQCIGSDERCDGIAQCHDHSDESAKYCDLNYIEPKHDPPSPLITVECDDSPFIITTTTTTTTPPTTTPTPTPTTTTTPPTTTTTTSPTTTTTPPTTTTTQTTTTTPPTTTTTSPTTTTTPTATTTTATHTSTTQHLPEIKTESTNKTIAIGIGIAVTAIIVVAVAVGVYCYCRHRNRPD